MQYDPFKIKHAGVLIDGDDHINWPKDPVFAVIVPSNYKEPFGVRRIEVQKDMETLIADQQAGVIKNFKLFAVPEKKLVDCISTPEPEPAKGIASPASVITPATEAEFEKLTLHYDRLAKSGKTGPKGTVPPGPRRASQPLNSDDLNPDMLFSGFALKLSKDPGSQGGHGKR